MKFTKIFLFTLLAIFSLSFIANTTNVAQAEKAKGIVDVTVVANVTPSLTTTAVSSITTTTASSGGDITSDGGASVAARGVAWSTSANPTIADSKTSDGTGTGLFTSSITGLTAGTTYYVRAYATNSVGTAYGNEVSFTTSAAVAIPPTPTSPSANISSACGTTSGTISWTASTGATTYVIYRSTSLDGTYTNINPTPPNSSITASPKTDSGLTAGQKYYYKIAAANGSGESAATAAVSYTVPVACAGVPSLSTTAVSSITGTTASSGGNTITDGDSAITAKGVVWSISSGPTTALATKTSNGTGTANFSSNITGLTAGTKYYVRAYATNSAGTGYGNEVSFTTPASTPSTPTGLSAATSTSPSSCGNDWLNLSWNASTGATSYQVYRDGGVTAIYNGALLAFSDTGLTLDSTHTYKVKATNAEGSSALSSSVSGTVAPACATAPATPTGLSATTSTSPSSCGNDWLNLSWNASTGATSYQVYRDGGATAIYDSSALFFSDTGLTLGSTHTYKVKATNASGSSALSTSVSGTVASVCASAPSTPTSLSATPSTCGNDWLNLSWNASTSATSYQVYRDGGPTAITLASYNNCAGGVCRGSDTGLDLGSEYSYKVKATNAGGSSALSPSVSGTVASACAGPTTASWSGYGACSGGSKSGYCTEATNGGTPTCADYGVSAGTNTTTCTQPNLTPRDGGWSDWSPVITSCPSPLNPIPQKRTCTNPALANGGADCVGPSSQSFTSDQCPVSSFTIKNSIGADIISSIRYNTMVNIAWTSTNATSCDCTSVDKAGKDTPTSCGNGTSSPSTKTLPLKKSMIYTLSCFGNGMTVSDIKTVTVDDINTIYKEN